MTDIKNVFTASKVSYIYILFVTETSTFFDMESPGVLHKLQYKTPFAALRILIKKQTDRKSHITVETICSFLNSFFSDLVKRSLTDYHLS